MGMIGSVKGQPILGDGGWDCGGYVDSSARVPHLVSKEHALGLADPSLPPAALARFLREAVG